MDSDGLPIVGPNVDLTKVLVSSCGSTGILFESKGSKKILIERFPEQRENKPQKCCNYGLLLFQVGPINHKRTLAFLNHFIARTVRFLNRFSCVCEEVRTIPQCID